MTVSAVIIDDEQNNIDNLSVLLKKYCPQVQVTATAQDADKGIAVISDHNPDLVFLDIQMPGKNGFEMLKSVSDYSFELIFVTAFDQYGIQAVKFAAIDYLLKPVDPEELKRAVQKAIQKRNEKEQNTRVENLIRLLQQKNYEEQHRIALSTLKETRFINPQQIIRCESSNNYTTFYIADGEKLLVSKPIFEYEELLKDYGFIRCHQSHLVNKKYVRSRVRDDGDYLLLEDGVQIPVSRNKKDTVNALLQYPRS